MSAMASETSLQIIRNLSTGLEILRGDAAYDRSHRLTEAAVRCLEVAVDGSLLAWAEASRVKVISMVDYSTRLEVPLRGVQFLKFSPRGTILAAWYPFKTNVDETNLHLFNVATGTAVISLAVKKMSRWAPIWSDDETVAARHVNQELHFYEHNQFDRYTHKFFSQKIGEFSMATAKATGRLNVACYTAGTKGQPSFVRLYTYPKFDGSAIANKSFYKADTVSFLWSPKGDALLIQCATDTDKTGKSYYGEQTLHYMDTGGTTFAVQLGKDGPVHNTAWTPNTTGESAFVVIAGFVPPKVGMFNCKGDVIFEFSEENMMVNLIRFNPFGNLVALAGFGNLRGGVHVWDVKRRKKFCHFDCPETTDLNWSPDGLKLLSCTTAPRLRVGNGIKVWKYTGVQTYADMCEGNVELYKAVWQPRPGYFQEPDIVNLAPNEKPVKAAPPPQKYIPPSMRTKQQNLACQKAALKAAKNQMNPAPQLSEKEKKIKNLEKKIFAIAKLKEEQSSGKVLEKNQIEKISKLAEIEAELKQLRLES